MAATIALRYPSLFQGADFNGSIEVLSRPVVGGQTVKDDDVLILSGGDVESAATNPASALAGLALHASGNVFAGGAAGASVAKGASPFGAFTSGFNDPEVTNMHFVPFHNGNQFEFSLATTVALADTLVGSQVGLVKDASGIYCVDTAGTNKVATIVQIVRGPNNGVVGTDNGGRVIVDFIASTLAL